MSKNSPLSVCLDSTLSTIRIEIGVHTLLHALMMQVDWPMDFVVQKEDEAEFVKSFLRGLEAESEDGTTPIHRMFDTVALECLESGDEGFTEVTGDEDGLTLEKRLVELREKMSAETEKPADPFENFSVQDLQKELARRGMRRW